MDSAYIAHTGSGIPHDADNAVGAICMDPDQHEVSKAHLAQPIQGDPAPRLPFKHNVDVKREHLFGIWIMRLGILQGVWQLVCRYGG